MKTIKEFLEWYNDQYSSGELREENYSECAYYLKGLLDSNTFGEIGTHSYNNMQRCISMLEGAKNLVVQLKFVERHSK